MQTICNCNNNQFLNTTIKGLLLATNIAFLVYFVVLAVYARPHYDDLHFMWKMQEMSIFDYVKDMYFSHSGRFGGYLLNGMVFSIINIVGASWFFPLLFIALGILICCYVATKVLPKANRFWLCNGVILFYFVYLLTNIDFAVVYWLCAMGYYLKFPIALLMFYFINKGQLSIWQWIVFIGVIISVGAGNEAFSPLILVLLFINGICYLCSNHYDLRETLADWRVKRLCIAAVVIFVLMTIVFIAPGNYIRLEKESVEAFYHPKNIQEWILGLGHASLTYHYFVLFYIPYYLILMAIAYLIGVKSKVYEWFDSVFDNKKRIILGLVLMYTIYIFCTILPSVFLYGNFGIQRNYTHTVFMTMLTLCTIGFLFGYWKIGTKKTVQYLSIIGLVVLLSVTIFNCRMDIPIAKAYANSVDNRISYCNAMKISGYKGVLEVEPLASVKTNDIKSIVFHLIGISTSKPSIYYISENKDAFDEYAYHMQRLYKWDFEIVIKVD